VHNPFFIAQGIDTDSIYVLIYKKYIKEYILLAFAPANLIIFIKALWQINNYNWHTKIKILLLVQRKIQTTIAVYPTTIHH
jgi:hypothetical protein